jgi:hypothetical protein
MDLINVDLRVELIKKVLVDAATDDRLNSAERLAPQHDINKGIVNNYYGKKNSKLDSFVKILYQT